MSKFIVVGAGLAGLFAAAVLRDECQHIIEAQNSLPNNHAALLRFRSSIVGDAVNIPFQSVSVIKSVASIGNSVADAIAYSIKVTGEAQLRSVLGAEGKVETRFIAPSDFISRLAGKVQVPVEYSKFYEPNNAPAISTIPMPILMHMLDYQMVDLNFQSIPGCSIRAKLQKTNLCATIYFPDPGIHAYRASITQDQLIVEHAFPEAAQSAFDDICRHPKTMKEYLTTILSHFGIPVSFIVGVPVAKQQKYAKILPIDDTARKRFILWASEKYNIYSFGRFATWRPGLLMDDLVNDLRVIQRLAGGESSYNAVKS